MEDRRQPDWLRASHLVAPVGRLTGGSAVTVDAWSGTLIAQGASEELGVWRVSGDATVDGAATPFTLILKGWAVPDDAGDPASWNWPLRNAHACASGLLDDLPCGIRGPRHFGTVSGANRSMWTWLSPMPTGAVERWNLEHYTLVARRLGAFNGAYLAGRPVPDAPWLSRRWLRQWVVAAGDAMDALARDAAQGRHARVFPPATVRALVSIWNERHRWLDALDTLPHTFCHLDAHKRNTFLRPAPGGVDIDLIDWDFTGFAAVGEEIVALVASSLMFGEAPGISPAALDSTVFESYLRGLCDAGWNGDDMQVRAAYTGSLALRYGPGAKRVAQSVLTNAELHPIFERTFAAPIDVIIDRLAALDEWVIDVADEFRRLLPSLPTAREVA